MSAMELRNFENQLELLSYTEQLAIIEYLAKILQKRKSEVSDQIETGDSWVSETFALMDSNPVFSNGIKWTREELHER
ncbi:MAG: hypothetical protein IKR40_09775 [Treponema sp.]|nr:hypothetical protein [Treponema sp.]